MRDYSNLCRWNIYGQLTWTALGEFGLCGYAVAPRWLRGGFGMATRWLGGGYAVTTGWLRGGYGLATGWLRRGYGVATGWLRRCYRVAMGWLRGCYGVATRWQRGYYAVATPLLRGSYAVATGWLRGGYGVATRWLRGGYADYDHLVLLNGTVGSRIRFRLIFGMIVNAPSRSLEVLFQYLMHFSLHKYSRSWPRVSKTRPSPHRWCCPPNTHSPDANKTA